MDNLWRVLKHVLRGAYIGVEPSHLFRYLDARAYPFNNGGGMDDAERFSAAVRQMGR